MDNKAKTSLDEAPPDFEFSDTLTTPTVPIKFNIVHDYLSDKTLPLRPSLQPLIKHIDPPLRQTFSTSFKPKAETTEEPPKEKKEVRFNAQDTPREHGEKIVSSAIDKTSEHIREHKDIDTPTFEEKTQESPDRSNQKKHKTVVIAELPKTHQETIKEEENSPERIKSKTFSSPNKMPKAEPRNSKLLAFARIIDPLEKIDQEHQASLDQLASSQKLIFGADLLYHVSKYPTFAVQRLEDLTRRLEELEQNVGKFTALSVSQNVTLIGTQLGFLLIYSEKRGALKPVHSGNDSYQNNSITALDISHDEELAVAGFSNSQIELFDLTLMTSLKVFKGLHSTPILALRFFHENAKSIRACKLLSSDNSSKVMKIAFEKGIFSYDCDKQLVLEKTCGQVTQIELLQSQKLDSGIKIMALSSLVKVLIIQLEPKTHKIFTLSKPSQVPERHPASVVWTEGVFHTESEDTSILLLVSWGNHYFLVNLRLENTLLEPVYKGQLVAHLQIKDFIKFSTFLSNRILFSLLENDHGVLINLEDFDEVSEKQAAFESLDETLKALDHGVSNETLDFEMQERFVFNSLVKDSYNMARSCYSQSFSGNNRNGLLLLMEDGIAVLNLFTWQKYVNSMINNKDRFAALACLIRIHKGEEKFVAGVAEIKSKRAALMREYAETMAQDYLILSLKNMEKKEEKDMRKLILTVSEFLIEIEDSQFLFTEIQKILQECQMGEQFLEGLEPFILKGKIR